MATVKKKTQTAGRKTQAKTNTTRKTSARKSTGGKSSPKELTFENEIILWILLAVSILLFISNFGIGGKIGGAASSLIFGIFGFLAYIFPVVLFIGICFLISNRNNHFAVFKFIACILLFCALCMFAQLLIEDNGTKASDIVKNAYTYGSNFKKGGGALGGIFVWLCKPNFGTFGSFVISVIVMIIALVLITERSIFSGMRRGGIRMYESAREDAIRYHDNQERRRLEREARQEALAREREEKQLLLAKHQENAPRKEKETRRVEKRVAGVALDTTITKPKPKGRDELNEITLDNIQEITELQEDAVFPDTAFGEPDFLEPNFKEPDFEDTIFTKPESVSLDPVSKIIFSQETPKSFPENIFPEEHSADSQMENIFGDMAESPEFPQYEDAAMLEALLADVGTMTSAVDDDISQNVQEMIEVSGPKGGAVPAPEVSKTSRTEKQEAKKAEKNTQEENDAIAQQMDAAVEQVQPKEYVFPPIDLLKPGDKRAMGDSKSHLMDTANKLQQTLKNFGVNVTITNVSSGPSVTRYEIQPEMGVKVSKIVNLTDDIKLNLAAADIRMEAPIPGKAAIGIEIPNKETVPVMFRDLVESKDFQKNTSNIAFAAGKDIAGKVIVADVAKMPHVLIAGATGSGKSVCINTIIMSILYKAHPDDVKLIMVDPKVVELSVYNGIPHLMIPVVTDPKKAAGALNWAVAEMTDRYNKFAEYGVREIKGYNAKVEAIKDIPDEEKPKKMPQIVIIVDELADLMMVASNEVETAICRLAQLARAAGIHLIIATQRPSVNVITGLIKANMPSRVAFAVTSGVDSRTILDMNGAEKLLGKGDMLFFPQNYQKPLRVQGAFVSDDEVSAVVGFIKDENGAANYSSHIQESVEQSQNLSMSISDGGGNSGDDRDVLFKEVGKFLIESEKGSIGSIQRRFKVGFNRAARIMDQLEEAGLVGPEEGTKPRKVLMSPEEFEQYIEEYV
ncbi:MAG: DNA translocase FtsK 4TM domain-containing protein [Lachnospiraceae bacterium]|nr:DNA translocase FtsK 4TM domain-containing protein [Lachnospiraceae bacterium]